MEILVADVGYVGPSGIFILKPTHTLPETNIAPENGWLEYDRFLLGWSIFRDELLVSGRVDHQRVDGTHQFSLFITDDFDL